MDWKRALAYGVGGTLIAVGSIVPAAAPAVLAGGALVGLAKSWPADKKEIKRLRDELARLAAQAAAAELEKRAAR